MVLAVTTVVVADGLLAENIGFRATSNIDSTNVQDAITKVYADAVDVKSLSSSLDTLKNQIGNGAGTQCDDTACTYVNGHCMYSDVFLYRKNITITEGKDIIATGNLGTDISKIQSLVPAPSDNSYTLKKVYLQNEKYADITIYYDSTYGRIILRFTNIQEYNGVSSFTSDIYANLRYLNKTSTNNNYCITSYTSDKYFW